jgi:hypothetical protein
VDARRLEHRHAARGHVEDRLEMLEILGQRVELEILGDAGHAPGLGARLEGAQHHLAGVGLVIGAFVGNPQDGQVAEALDRFRHKIEMLAGMKRQRHARPRGKVAAPHAAAIDDDVWRYGRSRRPLPNRRPSRACRHR